MTSPALALPRTPVADMSTVEARMAAMKRASIWTPEQAARYDALRNAEYCLVRIDGDGERWRCGRCNQKHTHYTLMCLPRPWRGLTHALYAYWANAGSARESDLSPAQRANLDILAPIFGGRPTPLATAHPLTAAVAGVDDRDVMVGATVLGSIDPISRPKAALYVELINSRARARVISL
jgi:hypothetical protein